MTKSNGNESQTKEEGLMRQIEQAKKKGDTGLLNFLKSELAKHEREYDIALEHCQKALDIDPENPRYLVQMGSILNRLRRFQNAIEFFDRVPEIDDENIEALKGKGFALSRLQKNQEAIEHYDRVLNLDLTDFEAWSLKGTALSFLGEHEKALKCFEKALNIKPNSYKTLRSKAFALFRSGKLKDAINVFDRLLERSPTDLNIMQGKATVCFYGKAYEEAIETFKEAIDLLEERKKSTMRKEEYKEKKVNYLRKIGASLSALENDEGALYWFNKALEVNPKDYNTLRNKGVSLSRLGREEEALKYFDKALKENPGNFPAWRERGATLSNLGREEEAIECYKKAIEINPDDFHSYRHWGVSLGKLGMYEKARNIVDIALKINPNDFESLREIGIIYFRKRQYDMAKNICRKLGVEPEDSLAYLVLAVILEEESRKLERRGKILEKECRLRDSFSYYEMFRKKASYQQKRKFLDYVELEIDNLRSRIWKIPESDALIEITRDSSFFDRLFSEERAKTKEFQEFLTNERSIEDSNFPSFLMILKRWSSYTPLLPLRGEQNKGGGYFLYHRGKGIVIDPGINFVENFYKEGFNFADIDAIMITHAHIDHTIDLESILTLVFLINKIMKEKEDKTAHNKNSGKKDKKIDLFLNRGAFRKYREFICCDKLSYINRIYELEAGQDLSLSKEYGEIKLFAVKAKHDEIIDNRYCLGYVIEIGGRKIGITGDTGWNPDGSIGDQYRRFLPDIMIVHIGSVKEFEREYPETKNPRFYSTHLGLHGATELLNMVRPNVAIISEFGEELENQRICISQKISKATKVMCLPGDIGLCIRIPDLTVFCEINRQFIPYEDIAYEASGELESSRIHYFKRGSREELYFEINEEIRRKPLPERIEERKENLKRWH